MKDHNLCDTLERASARLGALATSLDDFMDRCFIYFALPKHLEVTLLCCSACTKRGTACGLILPVLEHISLNLYVRDALVSPNSASIPNRLVECSCRVCSVEKVKCVPVINESSVHLLPITCSPADRNLGDVVLLHALGILSTFSSQLDRVLHCGQRSRPQARQIAPVIETSCPTAEIIANLVPTVMIRSCCTQSLSLRIHWLAQRAGDEVFKSAPVQFNCRRSGLAEVVVVESEYEHASLHSFEDSPHAPSK